MIRVTVVNHLVHEHHINTHDLLKGKSLNQLGLDSLDIVELLVDIESNSGIKIPLTEVNKIATMPFPDMIRYLERKH